MHVVTRLLDRARPRARWAVPQLRRTAARRCPRAAGGCSPTWPCIPAGVDRRVAAGCALARRRGRPRGRQPALGAVAAAAGRLPPGGRASSPGCGLARRRRGRPRPPGGVGDPRAGRARPPPRTSASIPGRSPSSSCCPGGTTTGSWPSGERLQLRLLHALEALSRLLAPGGPAGRRGRGDARRRAGRAAPGERPAGAHRGPPGRR